MVNVLVELVEHGAIQNVKDHKFIFSKWPQLWWRLYASLLRDAPAMSYWLRPVGAKTGRVYCARGCGTYNDNISILTKQKKR